MPKDTIPFKETHYFSSLICDYLDEISPLKPFYNRFPKVENFKLQMKEKSHSFPLESRGVLVDSLNHQYKDLETSTLTQKNIASLINANTFTVTTGHQLNIFTGPLYFFYKIISTINLCKELKASYPDAQFVPIYWMATEDHDFEEINYFNFKGKKIKWSRDASGAVGELDLKGLDQVYEVFSSNLDKSRHAESLKQIFKEAYLNHENLTDATRYLVNKLFSAEGLVILDGNDKNLKSIFTPYIENELTSQESYQLVTETNLQFESLKDKNYKIQVHPREINLFYITDRLRERIVEKEGKYYVNDTNISWSRSEILEEVNTHPERFSPNVILRPLYQEVILPNLCYIGGGGELAYWLQLKSNFDHKKIPFPILLLRNSVLLITDKQKDKLKKLDVSISDLFLNQDDLMTKITKKISEIDIDFSPQKKYLKDQFKVLYELAEQTDGSFKGAVAAQETKQIKGLEHLEKRLLKAQKRKLVDVLERVIIIQNELFPGQSLQERNTNFAEFYLEYGELFKTTLIKNLKPLQGEFQIIKI